MIRLQGLVQIHLNLPHIWAVTGIWSEHSSGNIQNLVQLLVVITNFQSDYPVFNYDPVIMERVFRPILDRIGAFSVSVCI